MSETHEFHGIANAAVSHNIVCIANNVNIYQIIFFLLQFI